MRKRYVSRLAFNWLTRTPDADHRTTGCKGGKRVHKQNGDAKIRTAVFKLSNGRLSGFDLTGFGLQKIQSLVQDFIALGSRCALDVVVLRRGDGYGRGHSGVLDFNARRTLILGNGQ